MSVLSLRCSAEFIGVKHCIAMCNRTAALEIAIRALGLTRKVIVPSIIFVATARGLERQQVTPVFCDKSRLLCHVSRIKYQISHLVTGFQGITECAAQP